MASKPLVESEELRLLRSLHFRFALSSDDSTTYYALQKGYDGEVNFNEWLSKLPGKWLVLHDLLLKFDNNLFQIDTLLIFRGKFHIINVKNFDGNYYIEDGTWYAEPRKELKNPLTQLERSESLLRRMLQSLGFHYTLESYLVFINPEFSLYNAPRDLPAVFPTQLERYKKRLLSIPADLIESEYAVAKKLVSLHIPKSPYALKPEFSYKKIKKGILCLVCHSFIAKFKKLILDCESCGHKESVESAVLRAIDEFILVNSDEKITVKNIFEWCKIIPKRTIQKILSKHFKMNGYGKYLYCTKK